MSIRKAGFTIRDARKKSGLTLEELSEGICSVQALCRIEQGKSGISPSTFNALMGRMGVSCTITPIFQSINDFNCFSLLKQTQFYCDSWQLNKAYESLCKVEQLSFNNNCFYYQEWLYVEAKILFRTYQCNHNEILSLLLSAIHISLPHINLYDFNMLYLSITEINILTLMAHEALYLDNDELSFSIFTQVKYHIDNRAFSDYEKNYLLFEYAICHTKYLIKKKDFLTAYSLANKYRHIAVVSGNEGVLYELNFLTGISCYFCQDTTLALRLIKDTFYSALATDSNYAWVCYVYLNEHLKITLPCESISEPNFNFHITPKEILDSSVFSHGIFDIDNYNTLSIGRLIQTIRIKNNISQGTLCYGLCSKSKLSKIENDMLQPNVFLAEALLQRLGISEREFVFCGSTAENEINNIKYKLLYGNYLTENEKDNLINKLQEYDLGKNIFCKQLYLLFLAFQEENNDIRLEVLQKALNITLPNFNPAIICSYRLSWTELTILNNIAYAYKSTDNPLSGLELSRKIIDYQRFVKNDIIFRANYYPYTIYQYTRSLFAQESLKELLNLYELQNTSILKYKPNYLGGFLFYLCQAYGSYSNITLLKKYSIYSIALQNLHEHYRNAILLKNSINNEFGLGLEY